MRIGMIGLGKMGATMAERIRDGGREVVGYDTSPGARDVDSFEALIAAPLFARFSSRQPHSPTMQAVAVLRDRFGGHGVTS